MGWQSLLQRPWFIAIIIAIWAFAYLPNLGYRNLRLEEGRRATPAREMIATGEYAKPTLYGDTYLNKPPFFCWLIAICGSIVGEVNPLAARIPSVIAAIGCALCAFRFAPKQLNRESRTIAALLVLASSTLLDKGTLGEIDSFLSLLIAMALKSFPSAFELANQATKLLRLAQTPTRALPLA